MIRHCLLFVIAIAAACPAGAAPPKADEALVMRIIFEDCLGYVRFGQVPFKGLATRPASAEAIASLPSRMPDRERAVEFLSPRYVASWGEDSDARHCVVQSPVSAAQADAPFRLGVLAAGFLQRVTVRAAAAGLTESHVADELSPLASSYWSEPETGHESGPHRPVSVTLLPTTPTDARGIADVGLIVMGGPPGGHR